ncbi:hypothetical protein JX580_00355 [Thiomicrospira microaerophila]|uniref:hypothetical protein n=1 Tax=Thiomicrospira microaerophila TaxID=406020 RepID=UPI00200D4AC8|nr:hypothetical protein [Thiomicrospira microaerophila]UQB42403.1 hypothetical protein JX580_00355 [Thiomicrospira microaerophila]
MNWLKTKGRGWLSLVGLISVMASAQAKPTLPLEGSWVCPSKIAISMIGQPVEVAITSHNLLNRQGQFASRGQASVNLGFVRPTVNAVSQGRWQRQGDHLVLEVESLSFSPATQSGVQLQYALISQLEALLPPMPYRQQNKILLETLEKVIIGDPQGQRYQCERQP